MDRPKAQWTTAWTEVFLKECVDQVLNNHKSGNGFSRAGWQRILDGFNHKTGLGYDLKQIKNRYEHHRREWRIWSSLMKESGPGRDPETGAVTASDEWWAKMKAAGTGYDKFRQGPLKFKDELKVIFEGTLASGQYEVTHPWNEDDDPYIPVQDWREGSGDSEEDLHDDQATGLSSGFTAFQLASQSQPTGTTFTQPTGSDSARKRKRTEAPTSSRHKKKGVTWQGQAVTQMSRMADVATSRSERKKKATPSVEEVITLLRGIPEVMEDLTFRRLCFRITANKTMRALIMSFKDDKDLLLDLLREHVYTPPEFLKKYLP